MFQGEDKLLSTEQKEWREGEKLSTGQMRVLECPNPNIVIIPKARTHIS